MPMLSERLHLLIQGEYAMRTIKASVLLFALASITAVAQPPECPDLPPLNTPYHCIVDLTTGVKVFQDAGAEVPTGTEVHATFYVTGYTTDPCGIILNDEHFVAVSNPPTLGPIEFTPKPDAEAPTFATLISNGQNRGGDGEETYTLTITLNLNARADALGGTFGSDGPLVLENTEVSGLPPFESLCVRQQAGTEVTFRNGESGEPRFGLKDVTVNLNGTEPCP